VNPAGKSPPRYKEANKPRLFITRFTVRAELVEALQTLRPFDKLTTGQAQGERI
jgi:hypothetical protein